MTHPVVYTAACPQCNGAAEWTAIPILHRTIELTGAHPTIVPEYRISCHNCDGSSK